ncbi:acyl-CoA dehydrogenase/oxidase C-terminal [Sarocladium strictum]
MAALKPSGADTGFFQENLVLQNQFQDDQWYRRCFKLFLSEHVSSGVEGELTSLADEVVSDQIFSWVSDAERNTPFLKGSGRDSLGHWKGELVTGEGWRNLQAFGLRNGFVAAGYDTPYKYFARTLQFLRLFLWEGSCANVTCPSAMQDGAACLLQRHLADAESGKLHLDNRQKRIYEDAFHRLTSRDPEFAWTSGQWMTERTGGSDVSLTETTATHAPSGSSQDSDDLGPWSINGFKWFSSATDANMTILLARTQSSPSLSAFLAPLRLPNNPNVHNGIRIQRLKEKLGTKPLPTAELVLENMRGWMVGKEGEGIREISTMLTLTRVHTAVTAVGYVGRALGIARAWARVREVGTGKGKRVLLRNNPLHMRTLADMTARYHGLMLLTFFTTHILGLSEHPSSPPQSLSPSLQTLTPPTQHVLPLLRVLTPILKAYVSRSAVDLMFSCVECLGGVGYLVNSDDERLNVARLYRDCAVLPIWEGTTDVLCSDLIRALKHPKSGLASIEAIDWLVGSVAQGKRSTEVLGKVWTDLRERLTAESQEALTAEAREVLWKMAELFIGLLLHVDSASDDNPASRDIFSRFMIARTWEDKQARGRIAEELSKDIAIVYGKEEPQSSPAAKL